MLYDVYLKTNIDDLDEFDSFLEKIECHTHKGSVTSQQNSVQWMYIVHGRFKIDPKEFYDSPLVDKVEPHYK